MNRLSNWPLERTLQIIGGRWKLYIICHLIDGPKRLSVLERGIPGIAQKVLIQQLREMEEHGLVTRQVFAEVPARVEYRVTALGLTLKPIIAGLQDWGIHQGQAVGDGEKLVVCSQSGRRVLGDAYAQSLDA